VNKVWIFIATATSILLVPTDSRFLLTAVDSAERRLRQRINLDLTSVFEQHSDRSPVPTPTTTRTISVAIDPRTSSIGLSKVEKGIIAEMNRARSNPPGYRHSSPGDGDLMVKGQN
jgi:hypothetical protein